MSNSDNVTTPATLGLAYYVERIYALSSFLNKYPCCRPFSNIDPLDPESNPELRSYYYLATLLTTGKLGHGCAVTSILLPTVLKCIVVNSGDGTGEKLTGGTGPSITVHTIAEGRDSLRKLGSAASDPDTVGFEQHAGDVLHALKTFQEAVHAMAYSPPTLSPYWYFLRFIICRCHLKIAETIQNGEKIWRVHPMSILQHWTPLQCPFERQEFPIRHQILESTLSLYGIHPLAKGKRGSSPERANTDCQYYYFASDNAGSWASVACAVYGAVEKRLFTPYFDGTMPPKNLPRATMDLDSIVLVADYLDAFAVLLDLPVMREILTHATFTTKLELMGHSGLPAEDGFAPQDSHEEAESPGDHVYRYLRAVVAWVSATLHLTQLEVLRNHIPIEVYHVRIPAAEHTPPVPSMLKDIREAVVEKLPEDERGPAGAYIDRQIHRIISANQQKQSCIHPEAVLMGILFASPPCTGPDPLGVRECQNQNCLSLAYEQGYVAIGTTRNCCFSCWWLAYVLSKHDPEVEVVLTGTNGLVRPWIMPDAGHSLKYLDLRDLEATLMNALRDECTSKRALDARGDDGSSSKHHSHGRLLTSLSCGLLK